MQSEISPSLRSNDNLTVVPGDRRLLGGSSVEILNINSDPPFSHGFLDKDPESSKSRSTYFKIVLGTLFLVLTYVIWGVLPIYWASIYDLYNHAHNLQGWIVDLDGGSIGQTVSQAFIASSGPLRQMTWMTAPSDVVLTTREQFEHAPSAKPFPRCAALCGSVTLWQPIVTETWMVATASQRHVTAPQ